MALQVKLGKLEAKRSVKNLALGNYLTPSKVAFPPVCAWERSIDYGMMRNDKVGDCTIAAAAHMEMNWQAVVNAGTPLVVPDEKVIADYSAVGGYDPATGANDNGCYMLDVLHYWLSKGIAGREAQAFATLDLHNLEQVKAAIYLFGGVYFGFSVPLYTMEQTDKVWRVQTKDDRSVGGHAVCALGYGRQGFALCSWGTIYRMTAEFWLRYVDEAYCVISKSWLKQSGVSPAGLDLDGLLADIDAVKAI